MVNMWPDNVTQNVKSLNYCLLLENSNYTYIDVLLYYTCVYVCVRVRVFY